MKTSFSSEQDFINAVSLPAQKACKRYGYLPSVLIAQSCLENGYGIPSYWDNPQIEALLKYNNMVGIKSELLSNTWNDKTVWPGKSLTKQTPETYNGKNVIITDNFRIYDNIEQSFADFLLFLKYASNYGKGGTPKYGEEVLSIKDPQQLIKAVHSRGYATGTTYSKSIMSIINKHNLTKYDNLSNIKPTKYTPGYKEKSEIKITQRVINDITAVNKSQIPAKRGNNPIKFIVIHYLGVPNADNPYLYGGGYGGHYNIKRDGSIYMAADPKTAVIWHCGGGLDGSGGHTFHGICTNYNSIGIECGVCYAENVKEADANSNKWYFSEETQESLVWLVSRLMDEYRIGIDHVIRHYDVTGKICPNPYVKNNKLNTSWTWEQFLNNLKQYRKNNTIQNNNDAVIPPKKYLSIGDNSNEVKMMQTMLIACGYSCGSAGADGDFGNNTLKAVKQFQKDANLSIDGMFGSQTKTALEILYASLNKKQQNKEVEKPTSNVTIIQPEEINGTIYKGINYKNVYNYSYYRKSYEDLRQAFGKNKEAYFKHFIEFGMNECRQASKKFNPKKYRNRYSDLEKAFGNNWPEYYKHYILFGKKEGRKAT